MSQQLFNILIQAFFSFFISLFSAWLAVKFSQRKFREERLWDRKVIAYERVIDIIAARDVPEVIAIGKIGAYCGGVACVCGVHAPYGIQRHQILVERDHNFGCRTDEMIHGLAEPLRLEDLFVLRNG